MVLSNLKTAGSNSFKIFDDYGNPLPRPNTLLIDSAQLESGDALDKNFRKLAADEIARYRREIVVRTGINARRKISPIKTCSEK